MRIKRRRTDFQGDYAACLNSKRAVAYIRGSTKKQQETIPMQHRGIAEYCERTKLELAGDPFVERGVSASCVSSDRGRFFNRPQTLTLIAWMKENQVFHIVIWALDRMARDVEDTLHSLRVLQEQHGITVHFVMENIRSTDREAKERINMFAFMAEFEGKRRKERQSGTLIELRSQGAICGQYEPYGWKIDPFRKRTTRCGRESHFLLVNDVEQAGLARIRSLIEEGFGTTKIANILNAEGIKPKCKPRYLLGGEKVESRGLWLPSTVQSVLEHFRMTDGTVCVVDNRNGRLVFEFNNTAVPAPQSIAA